METAELTELLHDFGERWEITDSGSYWMATRTAPASYARR